MNERIHAFMDLISQIDGRLIPFSIQTQIVSYLPFHDFYCAQQWQSQLYFPNEYEFFMRKPRPVFGPMVWFDRILHRSDQGVVLYGLKKFVTEYGEPAESSDSWDLKLPSRETILQQIMSKFSLSDHGMCNSGFLKLIADPAEQLLDNEIGFIEGHFVNDWIARIDHCLFSDNATLETVMRNGYGELVFAMLYGILMHTQFTFKLKYQAARYFMVSAATDEKLIFSHSVIAPSIDKFRDVVRFLAAYPSDNMTERKQMADIAQSLVPFVKFL